MLTLPLWTPTVPLRVINIKMVVFVQTTNGSGFLDSSEFFRPRLKFCTHIGNFVWDLAFSKPHLLKLVLQFQSAGIEASYASREGAHQFGIHRYPPLLENIDAPPF